MNPAAMTPEPLILQLVPPNNQPNIKFLFYFFQKTSVKNMTTVDRTGTLLKGQPPCNLWSFSILGPLIYYNLFVLFEFHKIFRILLVTILYQVT